MSEPASLVARELSVAYGARMALRPSSVELKAGELVALVGPNGAGKSSLLKALAGLVPHAGTVTWDGCALAELEPRERARRVAYLPQEPALHWPMRARDLVALGRLPYRTLGSQPTAEDASATSWALEQTETARLSERSVDELSIGERARVLLARALAVRAPVLLVDEPIAMLDPYHQLHVMAVLKAYAGGSAGRPALVVAVLHDLALAARFCTRVLLLDGGAVVRDDRPERALTASSVERHYRVEPIVTTYGGEPLVVPWRRIEPRRTDR